VLVFDEKKEGALTSHRVRPISQSDPIPNIERIFGIGSRSAPALLQSNTHTMRMEQLHTTPALRPNIPYTFYHKPMQQFVIHL
jgi:hypothetical protein